jgi:hypothetical protein
LKGSRLFYQLSFLACSNASFIRSSASKEANAGTASLAAGRIHSQKSHSWFLSSNARRVLSRLAKALNGEESASLFMLSSPSDSCCILLFTIALSTIENSFAKLSFRSSNDFSKYARIISFCDCILFARMSLLASISFRLVY